MWLRQKLPLPCRTAWRREDLVAPISRCGKNRAGAEFRGGRFRIDDRNKRSTQGARRPCRCARSTWTSRSLQFPSREIRDARKSTPSCPTNSLSSRKSKRTSPAWPGPSPASNGGKRNKAEAEAWTNSARGRRGLLAPELRFGRRANGSEVQTSKRCPSGLEKFQS